jgi:hypothetical protein
MAKISDQYARAVHSSNLKVSREADKTGQTMVEDTDTLSAMGWADRDLTRGHTTRGDPVRPAPLAVSLERLLAGDTNSAHDIVRTLAEMVWRHGRDVRIKVGRAQAVDIARSCLAWFRNGTCKACGGHGYDLIPGVPSLSSHECPTCAGTGKIRLADAFPRPDNLELARWLTDEIERETGRAAPRAMALLAEKMELS